MSDTTASLSAAGWTTTFYDGFDGSSVDRSAWSNLYDGSVYWNGAFVWESDEVSVGDGLLTIGMDKRSDGLWDVGAVSTLDQGSAGYDFTYGRVEIRAKVSEMIEGAGPCFLLWPASDDHWPPEVDILETPKGEGMFTNHWQGPGGNNDDWYDPYFFDIDTSEWHTYTLDWTPDALTLYVDGVEIHTFTDNIPHEAMSIALQGHVGTESDGWYGSPNDTGVDSVDIYVDYVKVSQYTGEGTPTAPAVPEETVETPVETPAEDTTTEETPAEPAIGGVLEGSAGDDALLGSDGQDTIFGDAGTDDLQGGAGDDLISGASGNDTLTLGDGADVLEFWQGDGADWVVDFTSGTDQLYLVGITQDAIFQQVETRSGVEGLALDLGNGDGIFLQGVTALQTADFVFG